MKKVIIAGITTITLLLNCAAIYSLHADPVAPNLPVLGEDKPYQSQGYCTPWMIDNMCVSQKTAWRCSDNCED